MTTVAVILVTVALITGFVCMMTGTFFVRGTVYLPLSGLIAATVGLILSPALWFNIIAVITMVFCAFIAAATWSAGPDS